jgi:hypothetical protein
LVSIGEMDLIFNERKHLLEVWLVKWRNARLKEFDLFSVDVDAGDVVAKVSQSDTSVEPDIASSDDEYAHKYDLSSVP